MPSYSIVLSPYFDKIGPFDRPLTRLVLQSTDDVVSPPPPLTTEPGEQWLGLVMALLGGRTVGLFGQAADLDPFAILVRNTGLAANELAKWMRKVRRVYRYLDPAEFVTKSFELWAIPFPYPPNMASILADVSRMQVHADPLLLVNDGGMTFQEYIDPLWDMGAMYWRLYPGHLRLQLDTRFVGPKELERHLQRTAEMGGIDLWPMKV
jgi:hypothetical protein